MPEQKPAYIVVVHTKSGTHVQVKGGNNQIVWTTEVYANPRNAQNAIQILRTLFHVEPRIVVKDERKKPNPKRSIMGMHAPLLNMSDPND